MNRNEYLEYEARIKSILLRKLWGGSEPSDIERAVILYDVMRELDLLEDFDKVRDTKEKPNSCSSCEQEFKYVPRITGRINGEFVIFCDECIAAAFNWPAAPGR